jgi:hypothetical protein
MTDKEMWEQDIEFMAKLREENEELKKKIEKAIEFIGIYTDGINLEAFDCLKLMLRIEEILKD